MPMRVDVSFAWKPKDESSSLHPVVTLVVTAARVALLHAGCAQRPTSQVLIGSINEVLAFCKAIATSPSGFKHLASGEDTIFPRAVWHLFDID